MRLIAALCVGLIVIGIVMVARHHDHPAQHPRAKIGPSQQVGDTADLMRRLERKKLVTTTR